MAGTYNIVTGTRTALPTPKIAWSSGPANFVNCSSNPMAADGRISWKGETSGSLSVRATVYWARGRANTSTKPLNYPAAIQIFC
ncbi:hypothetical protein WOLCODRAFT_28415 [Wolfiporia cocos MD-104 SS10]|uniref:Uncharacterized protein n=1 Tax=Wolfiporia cocos (strain MD-104) TaxID=742152 RepID=A0A2H3J1V3_WOLCO|nr:hypothetical protein WOLCODRAFT_28415 [Wolfiporia cocos MD-104 SS10]